MWIIHIFQAIGEKDVSFPARKEQGDSSLQGCTIIESGPKSRFMEGRKTMFERNTAPLKDELSTTKRYIAKQK